MLRPAQQVHGREDSRVHPDMKQASLEWQLIPHHPYHGLLELQASGGMGEAAGPQRHVQGLRGAQSPSHSLSLSEPTGG